MTDTSHSERATKVRILAHPSYIRFLGVGLHINTPMQVGHDIILSYSAHVATNFSYLQGRIKRRGFDFPKNRLVVNYGIKGDVNISKKSITIVGKPIDYVYIIRDVNVDEIGLEKYAVKCSNDIEAAWGAEEGANPDEKTIDVVLQEKISSINLSARPGVVEIAANSGGKIIHDFVTEKTKRGKKAYISELIFSNEAS